MARIPALWLVTAVALVAVTGVVALRSTDWGKFIGQAFPGEPGTYIFNNSGFRNWTSASCSFDACGNCESDCRSVGQSYAQELYVYCCSQHCDGRMYSGSCACESEVADDGGGTTNMWDDAKAEAFAGCFGDDVTQNVIDSDPSANAASLCQSMYCSPTTYPNPCNCCGDQNVSGSEECDPTAAPWSYESGSCTDLCRENDSLCGNGVTDTDEECDDGNTSSNDACSNACKETTCGDGVIQYPNGEDMLEECDNGLNNSGYYPGPDASAHGSCSIACERRCVSYDGQGGFNPETRLYEWVQKCTESDGTWNWSDCTCACDGPRKHVVVGYLHENKNYIICADHDDVECPVTSDASNEATSAACQETCAELYDGAESTGRCETSCICGCKGVSQVEADECFDQCFFGHPDAQDSCGNAEDAEDAECCKAYCDGRLECLDGSGGSGGDSAGSGGNPSCFPAPTCPAGNACVTYTVNLDCECEAVQVLPNSFCSGTTGGGTAGGGGSSAGSAASSAASSVASSQGSVTSSVQSSSAASSQISLAISLGSSSKSSVKSSSKKSSIASAGKSSSKKSSSSSASSASSSPLCGNGVQDYGEECDNGENNDNEGDSACRENCLQPFCGDGVIDTAPYCDPDSGEICTPLSLGEQCDCGGGRIFDSGNPDSWSCVTEVQGRTVRCSTNMCQAFYCGDGNTDFYGIDGIPLTEDDEECDAGENNSDELSAPCSTTCKAPRCGDGVIQPVIVPGYKTYMPPPMPEQCDDGSTCADGTACDCLPTPPGDTLSPRCCADRSSCTPKNNDGCNIFCQTEPSSSSTGGGGTVGTASSGIPGSPSFPPGTSGQTSGGDGGATGGAGFPPVVVQPGGTTVVLIPGTTGGGGGGGSPQNAVHAACVGATCTLVPGPGADTCGVALGCGTETHAECVQGVCTIAEGPGANACATDTDCLQHTECANDACVVVTGPGFSQCTGIHDCAGRQPAPPSGPVIGTVQTVADVRSVCGNGITEYGESCDDGDLQSGDGCSSSCGVEFAATVYCGNRILEPGEQCDDGNIFPGDGCTASCTVESDRGPVVAAARLCGNGIRETGEECDDGNARSLDGCSQNCFLESGACGDGILQRALGEQCEPSLHDASLGYGCNPATCRYLSRSCGDGRLDSGEECDAGPANADTRDASCRADCSRPRCGDAVLNGAETCDDGNRRDGDGCSAACVRETTAAPDTTTIGFPQSSSAAGYGQVGGLMAQTQPPFPMPVQPSWMPFAQLQPIATSHPPAGDTGPALLSILAAGAASGWAVMRRRRRG